MMALRQDVVRLLIADDVGIGKTIEAALVATELLKVGDARGLTVLCSRALAELWQGELREKFGLEAELVLPSTVRRLERGLIGAESIFERYPVTVVSTDFIKSARRRHEPPHVPGSGDRRRGAHVRRGLDHQRIGSHSAA